ncbi:MAG: TrpB-like pyridoxal phosphate-dependent enzyme [Phycisphaerae bacterium]|nr:TrpB-like pyridoxal phosphate-dependent enzyme [Phycisphaerae bacterium]
MTQRRIYLPEDRMPKAWYNVVADLPWPPPPPLNPANLQPLPPQALEAIFPKALIAQEMCADRWVEIPEEIRKILGLWRPTPLVRALSLEEHLKTPARIYYKNESVSPPGSHKPNTAIAQAWYNKQEGFKRIATETGAGQWGSALAFAGCLLGLEIKVYMVRVSFEQKPYRKHLMHTWGAEVVPSPSPDTEAGRQILARDPDTSGSLGIAISEAVEDAATREDTNYSLGSVLNHVLLHQTVEGLEAKEQLDMIGERLPNMVIGCCGGGSNFAGMALPFVKDKLDGKDISLLGVEPTACPTMTRGEYRYDFGDTAQKTPLVKMHTLGHSFVPPPVHAGGLRYHGMAPLVSLLIDKKVIDTAAYHQTEVFEAALTFARTEGIIPAPETSHAIKALIDNAIRCRETNSEEVLLLNFSGHGHFDLASYDLYLSGQLMDYEFPQEAIAKAMAAVPKVDA